MYYSILKYQVNIETVIALNWLPDDSL